MAILDNGNLETLLRKLHEEWRQEQLAQQSAPDQAGGDASGIDANLQRTLTIMKPIASSGAAPDAMLIAIAVASLVPVIQANMSFVLACTNLYRQSHADSAAMSANAIPLLAESAHRIMGHAPEAAAASSASRRVEYAERQSSNQLAVT